MKFLATIFAAAAAATVADAAPSARAAYPSFKASDIKSFVLASWGPMEPLSTKGDAIIVDGMLTSASTIKSLKADGKKVVCYMSAGTIENFRADAKDAKSSASMGNKYKGFSGSETWIDVRKWEEVKPIMSDRISAMASAGCQAVELDNIDCYVAGGQCVSGASHSELKKKEIEYVKWLADQVHAKGMAVGMKNSIEIIPDVISKMDFAINEQCQQYGNPPECTHYKKFADQNKVVFGVEYTDSGKVCELAKKYNMLTKYKSKSGSYKDCF